MKHKYVLFGCWLFVTCLSFDTVPTSGQTGFSLIIDIAWSPDGNWLAVAYSEELTLYDAQGKEQTSVAMQVAEVSWSPSSEQLIVSAYHNTEHEYNGIVLNVSDLSVETTISIGGSEAFPVAWSPVDNLLAVNGQDSVDSLVIYNTITWQEVTRLGDYSSNPAEDITWSPAGDLVATTSFPAPVRVWDIGTGELLRLIKGDILLPSAVAFSPDGSEIAIARNETANAKGGIVIFPIDNETPRLFIPEDSLSAIFDLEWRGNVIAAALPQGNIFLYDATSGAKIASYLTQTSTNTAGGLSNDGTLLAYDSGNATLEIVSIADNSTIEANGAD